MELEKTLENSLDSKEINPKGNQSIVKEINPEYSLEGLMLKLGHMIQRVNSLEKIHWERLRARGGRDNRG